MCYLAEFGRRSSNRMGVSTQQGVPKIWRTLGDKISGTDTDRSATYDLLLVFRNGVNEYGPISYLFRDICNIYYLARGLPLEFCNVCRARKTRMMSLRLPDRQKRITICPFV